MWCAALEVLECRQITGWFLSLYPCLVHMGNLRLLDMLMHHVSTAMQTAPKAKCADCMRRFLVTEGLSSMGTIFEEGSVAYVICSMVWLPA
eukprot:2498809-Amphidinium_carterae.2